MELNDFISSRSERQRLLDSGITKALTEDTFRQDHNFYVRKTNAVYNKISNFSWSSVNFSIFFPFCSWLKNYDWRKDFPLDLMAGVTVAILQIPHGLAFAPLGGQEPVVGLHMAVFPLIIYVIFGTSRHLSLGMFAVLIMMVGKVVDTHAVVHEEVNGTSIFTEYNKMDVGFTVTFVVGCWQLILGALNMGSLCVLLSSCVVSAFTSGAAVHVAFIQIKNLLRIPLRSKTGPLKLIFLARDIILSISEVHIITLGISLVVMILLHCFNEYLKPVIAKRTKIPVPIEFIIIVCGIVVSNAFNLQEDHGVAIVGHIPSGLPQPFIPSFSLIPSIIWDCLIIALVNITVNISLSSIFAKKGCYAIDQNQELRAYGLCNIFGSFWQCLPVCGSLSRTIVQFSVGGKSQMASVSCLTTVLLMLISIGPLFEKVPLCVLAAIVMVTLKGLFQQMLEFPKIWRCSRKEGVTWMVTFLSVVILDLDYGIAVGVMLSIVNLLLIESSFEVHSVLEAKNDRFFINSKTLQSTLSYVTIYRINGSLNFANCDIALNRLRKIMDEDLTPMTNCIIFDFSVVPYVDPSFLKSFTTFYVELKKRNIKLIIANCYLVYSTMEKCKFFQKFPKDCVLLSVEEAVRYVAKQ